MAFLAVGALSREVVSFNEGWKFRRAGETSWTSVVLPHDAAHGLSPVRTGDPDQGFIPVPVTTYRKTFARPTGVGRFALWFDGVYMDSSVRVNGRLVGGRRNGYLPFEIPLEDLSATNVVEVTCDARTPNTRWYQGCGIERDVWLVRRVGWTLEPEAVAVETELLPDGAARVKVRVEGAKVIEPAGGELIVRKPRIWTPETPILAFLDVTAENAKGERDTLRVRYGIRTVEFTVDRGLLLNGRPYQIKGICQHETFGALGGAFNEAATRRELAVLKDLGVNAIRTTHNPFAPRFYDLCDELGFLVKDEAFDEWRIPKTSRGYSRFFDACWTNDLQTFVRRDRNHPSVVLWSIGNEIQDLWDPSPNAAALVQEMVRTIRALDPTRPVTSGLNNPAASYTNGVVAALDVVGLNYHADWFAKLRGRKAVFGSETAPSLADRGIYLFEDRAGRMVPIQACDHRECAYSPQSFTWAAPAEVALCAQIDSPWSAGEFVWCTFDYLGEPNHTGCKDRRGYWPARSSYWGLCDLAGLPKDRYYLYRSRWNEKSPTIHLLPDWTHPGCEGKVFPVWCYTSAKEAELFLNGKSLGIRRFADTGDLHLAWDVPYEPGVLEVRAKSSDGSVITDRRVTAGPVARLEVRTDFKWEEVHFMRIDAVDAAGNPVLSSSDEVSFAVKGGEMLGADNGDPTDHTPFRSPVRRLFRGSAMCVIRGRTPVLDVRFASPCEMCRVTGRSSGGKQ